MHEHNTSPNQAPNFAQLYGGQPHQVARHELNIKGIQMAETEGLGIVERSPVADDQASWSVDYPEYHPLFVDMPRGNTSFRKEGDRPDPDNPLEVASLTSLEVPEVERDQHGYPVNPIGRTGLGGRFMLDKWGPTQAADPILTRTNPENGSPRVNPWCRRFAPYSQSSSSD